MISSSNYTYTHILVPDGYQERMLTLSNLMTAKQVLTEFVCRLVTSPGRDRHMKNNANAGQ